MTPTVYLFHGDDEVAMKEAVKSLQSKLGDSTVIEMNTTDFISNYSLDDLLSAAQATPFLTNRRLVTARAVNKLFSSQDQRARFIEFLNGLPSTTALVLLENPSLDEKNWLRKWAKENSDRGFVREFTLPQGAQLAGWMRERAKALGGELQPPAAAALAQLVGGDKLAAENEIQKLLAYVAYDNPVTAEDVAAVCLPIGEQGDFFKLIDSLSMGKSGQAIQQLETLFQERELIVLYFSLVGHFRALLQTRALLDAGKNDKDISRELGMHPFRAEKLAGQALRFSKQSLDAIYNRLLQYDEEVKTGKIEWELAMESFVAELSSQLA